MTINRKPAPKRKMIFCEPCSFKMIIEPDQTPDLIEIKTSKIPGKIPEIDPATGKTKVYPEKKQILKYKCPKCGRGVIVKELQAAYTKTYKQLDDKLEKERVDADRKKRLEDGKPPEKKTPFEDQE